MNPEGFSQPEEALAYVEGLVAAGVPFEQWLLDLQSAAHDWQIRRDFWAYKVRENQINLQPFISIPEVAPEPVPEAVTIPEVAPEPVRRDVGDAIVDYERADALASELASIEQAAIRYALPWPAVSVAAAEMQAAAEGFRREAAGLAGLGPDASIDDIREAVRARGRWPATDPAGG